LPYQRATAFSGTASRSGRLVTSLRVRDDEGREVRVRIWAGLMALAVGSFFAGDAAHRAAVALQFLDRWWPWGLLALAALNALRSSVRLGSLIGPGLITIIALAALALGRGIAGPAILDVILPLVFALGGVVLLLSAGAGAGAERRLRWTRILTTGRVETPPTVADGSVFHLRAIIGDLKVDMTPIVTPTTDPLSLTASVTIIGGHVQIIVPHHWYVELKAESAILTRFTDNGPRPAKDDSRVVLVLRALGVGGAVSLSRR
jgi:hypothetical protein